MLIRPDPTVWDGRVGNNSWLQELPKPLTKLVWENVLSVSPALAGRQSLKTGDVAVLSVGGRQVEGSVWVLPGQADGTVGVTLGYGQATPGLLSYGLGCNAAALRDGAGDPWRIGGASLRSTGRTASLATTQNHDTMEGHDLVRAQNEGAAPVGEAASRCTSRRCASRWKRCPAATPSFGSTRTGRAPSGSCAASSAAPTIR